MFLYPLKTISKTGFFQFLITKKQVSKNLLFIIKLNNKMKIRQKETKPFETTTTGDKRNHIVLISHFSRGTKK